MENKSKTTTIKNLLLEDIKKQLMSFQPVVRNGWAIKFSTHRDDNILLIFTSVYTAKTVVRYFTDEQDAVKFINYMMTQNPQEDDDFWPRQVRGFLFAAIVCNAYWPAYLSEI